MKNQNNLKNIEIGRALCPTSNGMKKLISALGVLTVLVFALPFSAQAVVGGSTADDAGAGAGGSTMTVTPKLENPIKYDTFSKFTAAVIETAVEVMLPFVVLGFIYSGFLFVKAQGKDEALTDAKKAIWWSIVGAFILFGAWGFAQIISTTISTLTK